MLRPANTNTNIPRNIQKSRNPEIRTNTPRMMQSRKNANPTRTPPRRRISAPTISLRKIIHPAAPVGLARISAVGMIAAMTVAMIADRIPAATVVVAALAVAVDAAVVAAPVVPVALAICRHRNTLHRKAPKARTKPGGIRVATTRVRKARIVALSLAVSNHAGRVASKIAALKHRARAVLPRPHRVLMPLKNRFCSPVSP